MEHSSKRFKDVGTSGDRRRATRYSFSATAEVLEIASGTRVSARAADLSMNGCYLDTLNPFAVGSKFNSASVGTEPNWHAPQWCEIPKREWAWGSLSRTWMIRGRHCSKAGSKR